MSFVYNLLIRDIRMASLRSRHATSLRKSSCSLRSHLFFPQVHYVFKYLHLSEVNVEAGQKVTVGQQIAASGNTGKSTAPHLHYQINVGNKGKVVDPMKYHKTIIEKLPESERENFKNRIAELDDLMK